MMYDYINRWCFSLKIYFVNKVKSAVTSADWFKLTNEILKVKGNIILCEAPVLHKLHVIDDNRVPRAFHLSDRTHLHHRPIYGKRNVLDTR